MIRLFWQAISSACPRTGGEYQAAGEPRAKGGWGMLAVLAVASYAQAVQEAPQSLTARGTVYHDRNGNRQQDSGEEGLAKIAVSNGRTVVETGADGRYEIPVDPQDGVVFVVKPRGWRTPLSEDRLPLFYYLHKPQGSPGLQFPGVPPTGALPASVNFPLYPQDEPEQFRIVLFGDTQARNATEELYNANTSIAELIGAEAAFGVTLGDIVFDDLSVFPLHNRAVALIGIPWYNVIGNHDINYDARTRAEANETYERHYGPSYYSFDYGRVHFVVLDNIDWTPAAGGTPGKYTGGFGADQLEFLKNDLARLPAQQMVVLTMHIPLTLTADRHQVYRLIEQRPLCLSISGHTHTNEHHFIDGSDGWQGPVPHHHIVNVTVCGSWWSGQKDERGVPHALMADGAPRGYSLLSFDGDQYLLDYKAVDREADYQLEISTSGELQAGKLDQAMVWANVFNGSTRSEVWMTIDGDETQRWPMERDPSAIDPHYQAAYDRELLILPPIQPALAKPKPSTHLWKRALPPDLLPGLHLLKVATTDMFGRNYSAHRVILVQEAPQAATPAAGPPATGG